MISFWFYICVLAEPLCCDFSLSRSGRMCQIGQSRWTRSVSGVTTWDVSRKASLHSTPLRLAGGCRELDDCDT